jgi:preprotein translocase subunit SecG
METLLVVFHMMLSIGLIGLILIQHGKGADMGAAFGSGASATVFGARGSASFLSRTTAILAALFFVTSMALAYFASQVEAPQGVMESVESPETEERFPPETEVPLPPGPQPSPQSEVPVPQGSAVPVPAGEQTAPEPSAATGDDATPPVAASEAAEVGVAPAGTGEGEVDPSPGSGAEPVASPASGVEGEQPAQ